MTSTTNVEIKNLMDNSIDSRKKKTLKKVSLILEFIENSKTTKRQEDLLQNELESYSFLTINEVSTWQLNRQFRKFQRFVNTQFNFSHKGFYTSYYMSIGMTLGLAIGTAVFDKSTGLSTGMMFGLFGGMLYGRIKDQKAEKENRVYNFRI